MVPGPQAVRLPACLLDAFYHRRPRFITKSLCKSFDLSGDRTLLSSVACCRLSSPWNAKRNSSGSRKEGEGWQGEQSGRETANIFRVPQTHNEFVTLSLTLEINRKRTWASSINMRQGHDRVSIYISIIYTLWVKLVCVNLLPFRGRKSCFWPT